MSEHMRLHVVEFFAPVLDVIATPLEGITGIGIWIQEITHLQQENAALKAENAKLLKWQYIAEQLERENEALRKLANYSAPATSSQVAARIIADASGPYVRSALISAGSNQGIEKEQAVINEKGLVGRIVSTGDNVSRVLLITDINSRIPIMAESTGERAILAGDNSENPHLLYLPKDSNIAVGERILTSADGGKFPHGIPVGKVSHIEKNEMIVDPYVDRHRLHFVNAVQFSLN
jgi:rod shape-determining protein MreC